MASTTVVIEESAESVNVAPLHTGPATDDDGEVIEAGTEGSAGEASDPAAADAADDTPTREASTDPAATPSRSEDDESIRQPIDEDEALTPIPTDPEPGLVTGVPLLVGGADLQDSLGTLTSYRDGDSTREILSATVTPQAEAKLLEALAISETKLVPVVVEELVEGRLAADEQNQVLEKLVKVAKSTNHHLKQGDGFPAHTQATYAEVRAQLEAMTADPQTPAADKLMAEHYLAHCDQIGARLSGTVTDGYAAGGKIPTVGAYIHSGMATVTKFVPAPIEEPPGGLLATTMRDATRIKPTLDEDGRAGWNGKARHKASGKEYVVDLGDGYAAVYRPHNAGANATDFSLRGSLEVIAPPGPGHGPELVHRLGQLHLVNRPMTASEGEWTYLTRQLDAQGLHTKPTVTAALAKAEGLEDAVEHVLLAQRAHQAIGLDEPGLHRFAKQLRLDAEAQALPQKVKLLRDAVATATGHPSGDALAASAGYEPRPQASGGWLAWSRFDVTADRDKVRAAFGSKGLFHHVTGNNLSQIMRTGVLACTERRAAMGLPTGLGMSESADKDSGGANAVFLRSGAQPAGGPSLFWDDPTVVLQRADWYATNGDHFGAVNPNNHHYKASAITRDPVKVAGFTASSNEVAVRNGLDLLGAEAPSRINCTSATQRKEILAMLKQKGISHLRGRAIEEVVVT